MMHRKGLEQLEMEEEKRLFFSRLFHLPLVATAMDQVNALYSTTKQRSELVRRTMERAETGVSAVIGTAAPPVILLLNKQLTSLNGFACDQLDKLETKYPIIRKPTEEVVKATRELCSVAVKPFVDRVSSAKQFGYKKVSDVRSSTGERLGDVRTSVGSVVQLGTDQWSRALTIVSRRSHLLRVDELLDTADRYVDSYLPPDEEEEDEVKEKDEEKERGGEKKAKKDEEDDGEDVVLAKAFQLGSKVQRRVWCRALKQMKRVQVRSSETLEKFNFTVDLIEYTRTNLNGATEKMNSIWTEINRTEEEIEGEEETKKKETDEEEKEKKKQSGLERTAIATARHLTLRLRSTLSWLRIPHLASTIPDAVVGRMEMLRQRTQSLVDVFSKEEVGRRLHSYTRELHMVDGSEEEEETESRARVFTWQFYASLFRLVSNFLHPYDGGERKKVKVEEKEEEMEEENQLSTSSMDDI